MYNTARGVLAVGGVHVCERTRHHVLTATVQTLWGSLEQSQAFPGVHVASGALKKEGVTV